MPPTAAQLDNYYRCLYPVKQVERLLTLKDDPLIQREFAADGHYYKRYITASCAAELRTALLQVPGLRAPQIGPVYSGAVTRSGLSGGTMEAEHYSRPHRRELVFDIDQTDYDFLTDLVAGGGTELDLDACDKAWPVAGLAVFFLKYVLQEQFGFQQFLVVYSGRRGVHLWVLDKEAMGLTDEARGAVASFVNFTPDKTKTRASRSLHQLCCTYGIMDAVWDAFETVLVEGMGLLDDLGARDAFVERIGLKHDGMSNLADEASRKPDGKAAWAYIKTKIADAAKRDSKCGWFTQRLEEVVLAYVWPRIDFNVTKAVNHLIKSPLVAHPKTGRIAVPIPRDDLLTFDPSRVPKLGDPNLAEALASRGCSLVHNISNEPPMVALDFERRLAKASKAKLVRSKRRGTPADGKRPPPSEDVEDAATMIFPMEVDAPTPPRPREVDRLRRPLAPDDLRKRAFVPNRPSPLAEGGNTHC